MIWNLIGTIGGKVLDIVDDVVEDKDEANRLKFQIQRQLIETGGSELEAQAKIVLAEAQGSWLQPNWRPMLMALFAGLVVAHWFGYTASNIPESVHNCLLNIVMAGVGGDVMGRSAEKGVNKWQRNFPTDGLHLAGRSATTIINGLSSKRGSIRAKGRNAGARSALWGQISWS